MWSLFHRPGARAGVDMPPASIPELAADLTVIGTVSSSTILDLRGEVRGTVQARHVTVSESAVVDGDIIADVVVVGGFVHGSITARKVRLKRTAVVRGNILHAEPLEVEPGANFVNWLAKVA